MRLPDCALVRSYVLNSLENGPARVADLVQRGRAEFGFSYGEVEAAGKHFAVVTQVKKGQIYWMRPANLFAIWWGLGPNPKTGLELGSVTYFLGSGRVTLDLADRPAGPPVSG